MQNERRGRGDKKVQGRAVGRETGKTGKREKERETLSRIKPRNVAEVGNRKKKGS